MRWEQSTLVKLYDAQVLVWHFSRFRSILCNSHGSCGFFSVSCQNDFTGLGWVTMRLD